MKSIIVLLVTLLSVNVNLVIAEDDEEHEASAAPSAAPSPAASAAAALDPAIDASLDEYIALIKAKDWKGWVERMTPADAPDRKKPDWDKKKEEDAKGWSQMMGDGADMIKSWNDAKGKAWTKSPDGKTATLERTAKDPATGAETRTTDTMELHDGKWYIKM